MVPVLSALRRGRERWIRVPAVCEAIVDFFFSAGSKSFWEEVGQRDKVWSVHTNGCAKPPGKTSASQQKSGIVSGR